MNISQERLSKDVSRIIDTRDPFEFDKSCINVRVNGVSLNMDVLCAMLDVR